MEKRILARKSSDFWFTLLVARLNIRRIIVSSEINIFRETVRKKGFDVKKTPFLDVLSEKIGDKVQQIDFFLVFLYTNVIGNLRPFFSWTQTKLLH